MAIFERRGIKREDLYLLFSACAFPVFLWAFYNLFYTMPGLLTRLNFSELLGSAAYVLAFALLESSLYFLLFGGLILLAALALPTKLLGEHLAVIGSPLALLIAALVMVIQRYSDLLLNMSISRRWFYLGMLALAFLIFYLAILRFPKLESGLKSLFSRFSVLSLLYVVLGLASFVLILVRNIGS